MKRHGRSGQDRSFAHGQAGRDVAGERRFAGPADLAGIDARDLEREQLPQPAAGGRLELDVPARSQLEAVERRLEGEAPPIHGRREGEDVRLDLVPEGSILGEAAAE